MPCPHARYHWTICPHCNGTNDIKQPQVEIEKPKWNYEIVEDGTDPKKGPTETVITIDI